MCRKYQIHVHLGLNTLSVKILLDNDQSLGIQNVVLNF